MKPNVFFAIVVDFWFCYHCLMEESVSALCASERMEHSGATVEGYEIGMVLMPEEKRVGPPSAIVEHESVALAGVTQWEGEACCLCLAIENNGVALCPNDCYREGIGVGDE